MNLATARMLRRLANAGTPLSRHALQMGTCGCKAADINQAMADHLVEPTPPAPGTPGKRGRRPFPMVQLTSDGFVAFATFEFPRTGRRPKAKTAWTDERHGLDWVAE